MEAAERNLFNSLIARGSRRIAYLFYAKLKKQFYRKMKSKKLKASEIPVHCAHAGQAHSQQMKRHRFNIFPEAKAEDCNRLKDDINVNGFDQAQPITIYDGAILDGWNRQLACDELGITPPTRRFAGSDIDAINFVMRSNKRRNLNSGQWAAVANEAEELIAAIKAQVETERREKISEARSGETRQIIASSKDSKKAATKTAELFNTNRTYVNQAAKIGKQAPEILAKVKAGKMTMQQAVRAAKAIPTAPWLEDESHLALTELSEGKWVNDTSKICPECQQPRKNGDKER